MRETNENPPPSSYPTHFRFSHCKFLSLLPTAPAGPGQITLGPDHCRVALNDPPETGGYLSLPTAPGFGVELADDLETRFPQIPGPWGRAVER